VHLFHLCEHSFGLKYPRFFMSLANFSHGLFSVGFLVGSPSLVMFRAWVVASVGRRVRMGVFDVKGFGG
jgi:hypothetical protein